MRHTFQALAALLLSAALLIAGNGLQASLLSVRADLETFSLSLIGFMMSAYYLGFIAGCRLTPLLVKRVGHIRTFAALASIASASALAHVLAIDATYWICLRILSGFAMAGVYMIIESWINEAANASNRGRTLAVYRIIDLTALTAGQALLAVADPRSFQLFVIVSIILSLALVPIALTTATSPKPIVSVDLNFRKLFRMSPAAALGCLCAGYANSAFWALGPVYAQRIGFDISVVASFMSATVIGGALSQWPVGLLSDRMDRRIVLVAIAVASSGVSLTIAFLGAPSYAALLAGGFAFGFFALPTCGIAVAHANDRAEPSEYVSLNAALLFLFGVGAVCGPVFGPLLMAHGGPSYLFVYTDVIYALLSVFTLLRMIQREAALEVAKEDFAPVPRSTPAVFDLDPRTPTSDD